jgi:hypothetical protein
VVPEVHPGGSIVKVWEYAMSPDVSSSSRTYWVTGLLTSGVQLKNESVVEEMTETICISGAVPFIRATVTVPEAPVHVSKMGEPATTAEKGFVKCKPFVEEGLGPDEVLE